jgi:N-acyl-D-aspartate/D-glutamate deacylase
LTGHHTTLCLFSDVPAYRALRERCQTPEALAEALRDPTVRQSIVSWTPSSPTAAALMEKAYGRTYVLGDPPDYEPGPERSLAGVAATRGVTPLEVAYDEMARDDGQGLLYLPILNYATGDLDHVFAMLQHPRGLLGLSDGGAHTGTICDASMPTFMLTHWTRDRTRGERLGLEYVVKKQTHDTARLYGMSDRGTVEPGALGDLNLIDYDALALGAPFVTADLPAGGRRLLQRAEGYVATIKKGTITFEHGVATGELPGRLVRGAR